MFHFKTAYKYIIVILVGVLIFLLDYFELTNPLTREIILFILSILKAAYFINFVFTSIRESADKDFYFQEFMSFVIISILLVVISFWIDYYCLFRIQETSFTGVIPKANIVTEFVIFSITAYRFLPPPASAISSQIVPAPRYLNRPNY